MAKSTSNDALTLIRSLRSAYAATPTNLKIIDIYVVFAITTALIQIRAMGHYGIWHYDFICVPGVLILAIPQVIYMGIVGSFPFNSFLSGVLSCVGTAVLAVCLRIQVNKENKDFKDLPAGRAFADFVLCNIVLHLVITNFLG